MRVETDRAVWGTSAGGGGWRRAGPCGALVRVEAGRAVQGTSAGGGGPGRAGH